MPSFCRLVARCDGQRGGSGFLCGGGTWRGAGALCLVPSGFGAGVARLGCEKSVDIRQRNIPGEDYIITCAAIGGFDNEVKGVEEDEGFIACSVN
jgi:hypothetical protein